MNSSQVSKIIAGGLGLACVMALSLLNKIDGPTALNSITWIVGAFIGGASAIGVAQVLMAGSKSQTTEGDSK